MKVATPPQAPLVKEVEVNKQFSASTKSLKRGPANYSSMGKDAAVKEGKKKRIENKKPSGETAPKNEDLTTLGDGSRKVFSEQLREQKARLKKVTHFQNEVVPAPKIDKDTIKRNDKSGFDSDSSYESDTYVNLWENIPNMRGGGKFPVGTK